MVDKEPPAVQLHREKPRIFWGQVIWTMIQHGWNPPPPTDKVMNRILDDMLGKVSEGDKDAARIRALSVKGTTAPTLDLSPREVEIIALVAIGLTYEEIGNRLGITKEAVKHRAKLMYRKLGSKSAAHAVYMVMQKGIIK